MAKQTPVEAPARTPSGEEAIPLPTDATPPASVSGSSPVIYFCGFERRGPSKYAVAVGEIRDGKVEVKVDPISQDLGNASEAVLGEFQRLAARIP